MNNEKLTFDFKKPKECWFVFCNISWLQKIMFLLGVAFNLVSTPILLLATVVVYYFLKTKWSTEMLREFYSCTMCTVVFLPFMYLHYQWCWYSPLVELLYQIPEKFEKNGKIKYWKTREKTIDKIREIYYSF